MITRLGLEDKFNKIKKSIEQEPLFTMQDIQEIFPDKQKSSLYWDVSKLVEAGYLVRIRNGVYKLKDSKINNAVILSDAAKEIRNTLQETGFDFYISGIDILSKFLHHIPEKYPIIVYASKVAIEEIKTALDSKKYFVTQSYSSINRLELDNFVNSRQHVLLIPTESFFFSQNNLATTEKAFLDLFYEITRDGYPLALQELVRMYQNLIRNGALDQKKLVKAAYIRNMEHDVRYIVESKYISDEAIKFVSMIKEGNML
ncbi:MAG: DUF6577 family protein [Saccharofermentanales bacterium]